MFNKKLRKEIKGLIILLTAETHKLELAQKDVAYYKDISARHDQYDRLTYKQLEDANYRYGLLESLLKQLHVNVKLPARKVTDATD